MDMTRWPNVETFYFKDGTAVDKEKWCWEAIYVDNTILRQFEPADGSFHQIAEINQHKLAIFQMVNTDDNRKISIAVPPGTDLIHYYTRLCLNVKTNQEEKITLYIFGYKRSDIRTLITITPDGIFLGET